MRLRNIPRAGSVLAANPEIVVANPKDFIGNWTKIFENNNPLHLEIGIGRGNFIINLAKQNPDINFLGIEKFDSVLLRALEKTIDNPIKNLRLLRYDANNILEIFGNGEIEKIYLNFSDPWERTSQRNKRMTHTNFLKKYEKILTGGGILQYKTDNRKFFEYSLSEFNNFGLRINSLNLDLHENEPTWNIRTEYEEKFAGLGKKIYFCAVSFKKKEKTMEKTIELGKGLGNELRFGMRFEEVKKILGEPSEIENSEVPSADGEDFGDTVAWIYDELGATLYFDEEDEWKLGTIEVDDDDFELGGKKLIGKGIKDVKNILQNMNINDINEEEIEAEEGEDEEVKLRLLFSQEKCLNVWFEDGVCCEIQWSSL
ncbi:MAG: tRNA (guanosine(46)-N7)-methyltransferase TrmB [Chitinivibrionia bacterium]|nr:tRNA (guanosine(46)-N7)-methyltransferase TrmB [Chitinivibrionia bacterium]